MFVYSLGASFLDRGKGFPRAPVFLLYFAGTFLPYIFALTAFDIGK